MEKYDCQMANTALIVERRFESKFQSEGTGSAVHVYDGNGDEVLTYTAGVGWHEKESKAETQVHGALKAAYYGLSEIEGKLLKIFTHGKCNISSREANRNQILIFKDKEDREEFEIYFEEHFEDFTDEEIQEEYQFYIQEEDRNELGGGVYSVFQVAKTAKIYEQWCNETHRKYYEEWKWEI